MPSRRRRAGCLAVTLILTLGASGRVAAQAPSQQAPNQPAGPAVSVGGVVFGNYQYHLGGQSKDFNQFLVERAYVTVRATVSERTSVRVTADVFQSGDQNGWAVRAKYAYLQYDLVKDGAWRAAVRGGMLHNVIVEHIEQFWPRFVAQVPLERNGGFASADVGAAALVSLPARTGEIYAHVVNGPGYTRRETDRFKDFAARLSLTPLAGRVGGPLATLTISPWFYEGATASRFVRGGGNGAIAPVGTGLPRDRYGIIVGMRDPRFTGALEAARMRTVTDTLGPGTVPTRVVADVRTTVLSAYGVLRPAAFVNASGRSRFGIIGRYDGVDSENGAGDRYHFLVAGLVIDVNPRSSIALDYQEGLANSGAPALPSPGSFRALFAHLVVNF